MDIEFPNVEAWDVNQDAVTFPADCDGRRIQCKITWEALNNYAGGNQLQPIDCFRANRASIESKARQLIGWKRFESDGSILIGQADVP